MKAVLIAHADPGLATRIENALIERGVGSTVVRDGAAALDVLNQRSLPLVIAEVDLPKIAGPELLSHVLATHPGTRVLLLSPDQSARAATQALRAGAFDYLSTPPDSNELSEVLDRFLNLDLPEGKPVAEKPGDRYDHIIGQSAAIRKVFRLVDKVAHTDSTVMIQGESGTGKELIARALHRASRRRDKPMIPVNCGAIPEGLLESELFGHEKGAFTSAIRSRAGRFELADGGTIFLDEIGDMSPTLQVKILRVLQEHQFERVGGGRTINVDIRVITATNKDLAQAVAEGRFREDLYYRLNVIPITVPPLRHRREDIPLLVEHFLNRFRETKRDDIRGIQAEALAKICDYPWPGNIRELENILERMTILTESDLLTVDDLPPRILRVVADTSIQPAGSNAGGQTQPLTSAEPIIELTDEGVDFNQLVSDFEDRLLLGALKKADWVKNKAAQLLKLNRTTLVEKLKKKGITGPAPE